MASKVRPILKAGTRYLLDASGDFYVSRDVSIEWVLFAV